MCLLLEPVQVHLDSFPTFSLVSGTTHLGVICKLVEGSLNSTVYVVEKDVEGVLPSSL